MIEIQGNLRLRPTRIGFLVKPSDMDSIRKIMRINSCLWGGLYNPIIPVFKMEPKRWMGDKHERIKGYGVAKGYIRFFEPDVYVEAEDGLLEKAGLEAFRDSFHFENPIISLNQFMAKANGGENEPSFGQGVFDILDYTYKKERQFKLRDERPAVQAIEENDEFAEICIGVYPDDNETRYISEAYNYVYEPETVKSTPETWLKVYDDGRVTPLRVTNRYIEKERSWHHEPIIFLFDPKKSIDLIDLWNLRIESSPVYPVPVKWFDKLSDFLKNLIKRNHRPLEGNPHGVMHHLTIEVGRSILEEKARDIVLPAFGELPKGSWGFKHWRNPVWAGPFSSNRGPRYERIQLTVKEKQCKLPVEMDKFVRTDFETLSPDFAAKYSGLNFRWVNTIIPSTFGEEGIATVLPFNTFDRRWPKLGLGGESVGITQEGWVFAQNHKDWFQPLYLLSNEEAFTQWFERHGIKAQLSEPGSIAKQMLNSLEGLWGLNLVKDPESIQFINKLAGSTRIRGNSESPDILEEDFVGRSASIKKWKEFFNKHVANTHMDALSLSDYTERKIMKLGLETKCGNCGAKNWHGLDTVNYFLECERCLKKYDFPQTDIKNSNENWKYRVIGPFAVPDYAQGAYSSLLSIKALCNLGSLTRSANFSTALNLYSNKGKCEIDFAVWSDIESEHGTYGDPQLIIGEAKSFASNAIDHEDIAKLKLAAEMLPGSVLVISVLKDGFSDKEQIHLKELVEWARGGERYNPKHLVILLTGTELFANPYISTAWKAKGEPYSRFEAYHHTRSLAGLSSATINIYLGAGNSEVERKNKATKKIAKGKIKRKPAPSKKGARKNNL